jgi:hypothetical protein
VAQTGAGWNSKDYFLNREMIQITMAMMAATKRSPAQTPALKISPISSQEDNDKVRMMSKK